MPNPPAVAPTHARAVGLVLTGLALALGVLIRLNPAHPIVQGLDGAWHGLVRDPDPTTRTSPLDRAAWFLNAFEGWPGYLLLGALVALQLLRRRWRLALAVLMVAGAGIGASALLKVLVDRPRPTDRLIPLTSMSWPSGHATLAACFVVVVAMLVPLAFRRWWWVIGGVILLAMMWSRTYLSVHWLTDTLGGAALGLGVGLLVWSAMSGWITGWQPGAGPHAR